MFGLLIPQYLRTFYLQRNQSAIKVSKASCRAFTLIELLIVVAIIGILAAVAVPNYLNARVRAQISRAYGDLRGLGEAIDAYTIDHGVPPPQTHNALGDSENGYIRPDITTPVAYLSSHQLIDPFVKKRENEQESAAFYYTYHNLQFYQAGDFPNYYHNHNLGRNQNTFSASYCGYYGHWRACSYGPDRGYSDATFTGANTGHNDSAVIPYATSNGLISYGNIWVSQARRIVDGIPPVN